MTPRVRSRLPELISVPVVARHAQQSAVLHGSVFIGWRGVAVGERASDAERYDVESQRRDAV